MAAKGYCDHDDVFRVSGLTENDDGVPSAADIDKHIETAELEIDDLTSSEWSSSTNAFSKEYFGANDQNYIIAPYVPVNSITKLASMDSASTETEYSSSEYDYDSESGKVWLRNTTFPKNELYQNIICEGTYGHASATALVRDATACIAGIATLVQQIGGTYKDATNYTVPSKSVSKGEPYTNIRETVKKLERILNGYVAEGGIHVKGLLDRIRNEREGLIGFV